MKKFLIGVENGVVKAASLHMEDESEFKQSGLETHIITANTVRIGDKYQPTSGKQEQPKVQPVQTFQVVPGITALQAIGGQPPGERWEIFLDHIADLERRAGV